MPNYVITIEPDLLAGAVTSKSVRKTGDESPDRADELRYRESILERFARDVLGGPHAPSDSMAGVASMMNVVAAGTSSARSGPLPAGIELLPGVGSLVVDDATVDVNSLKGVHGVTVQADMEVEQPVVVSTSAGPSRWWHVGHVQSSPPRVPATGSGILVGVLDTGVDASHSEFAGKRIHFEEFDRVGRKVGGPPRDAGSHGTHVSALVAGQKSGLAQDADLAVAAVLTTRTPRGMSGSLVQIAGGLNWLVTEPFRSGRQGVDLVNASLGASGWNPFLRKLIQNARVPVVAAIGNDGRGGVDRHGSPGNYPECLGVGATDITDTVADFSDWGTVHPPGESSHDVPDLCAPGVGIYSALPGGAFGYMSGTSMASPIVAGIAARVLELHPALRGKPTLLKARVVALATGAAVPHPGGGNLGGAGQIRC